MECQSSDSKNLFKVFDASKSKRARKKRNGLDDSNSLATDDSNSGCQASVLHVASAKASFPDLPTSQTNAVEDGIDNAKRNRDSSPSMSRSPGRGGRRSCRSPRKHRRSTREGLSLALKAGLVSTPRSSSPQHEGAELIDSVPRDQDSFIYDFLEEAIKKDKNRHRHSRRREERRVSHDREASAAREHRHHHRRRCNDFTVEHRGRDKSKKENQAVLFETFAKLCAQMNEKTAAIYNQPSVPRTLSHKSLQCEVITGRDQYDVDHNPVRLRNNEQSREDVSKTRSHENFRGKVYSHEKIPSSRNKQNKCMCCYDKDVNQYSSKIELTRSKTRNLEDDRYLSYPPDHLLARNNLDNGYRSRAVDSREYRDYDREYAREKHYENDKGKYYDQKTSRSYDVHRNGYPDDDKLCRRTARSDNVKEKHYYDDREKYYDDKRDPLNDRDRCISNRRAKRNIDRCDRISVASRDDEYKDRYSERERDSGLSVADGDTSTISGRSNYLKVVKHEIAEQRETMDKMMKLWKELMRCFKGLSTTQGQNKSVHDSAANAQESAAAQLRLWRECMRRYETVARDVGDTDARLMEEINKQRSEMSEMASMWQECLQRYREMSTDFNNLKQQVTTTKQHQQFAPEIPTRLPAATLACAEGEGPLPPAPYRLPPHYPQMESMGGGYGGGSPLRARASAPPAWWWCDARGPRSPRRRSSPESRGSRERRRRHKDRDRDDSRYKVKSSKPNGARSEHRHRKR